MECTRFCLCPSRVYFPVLCKFWQLCGGVNGDLLQEGLCHTQGCCTQSLCPCSRPPQTRTSTGDAQTQICLRLCGVPGSWCTQGMFEPSEHLWQVRGLILNMTSPLLPSCWGFSFALGRGVSFFGGIQHFPVDSCSAASCSFGVLAGEDELTSFYFSILHFRKFKKQNLNLPHSNNYLHSIYMILGIKNNLEVT